MLSESTSPPAFAVINEYVQWINQNISGNANPLVQDICVQYVQSLLSVPEYRVPFYQYASVMTSLSNGMKKATGAQLQYEYLYCFWMLTFCKEIANDIQRYQNNAYYK